MAPQSSLSNALMDPVQGPTLYAPLKSLVSLFYLYNAQMEAARIQSTNVFIHQNATAKLLTSVKALAKDVYPTLPNALLYHLRPAKKTRSCVLMENVLYHAKAFYHLNHRSHC
jgi:hypothetical protein